MTPAPAVVKEGNCHIILTLKSVDIVLRFKNPLDPINDRYLIPPPSTYYYIKINIWVQKTLSWLFFENMLKVPEGNIRDDIRVRQSVCGLQSLLGYDTVFDMLLNLSGYQHLTELQVPVFLDSLLPKILEIVLRERQLSTMVCFSVYACLFHSRGDWL